jgi:Uma2 family endonuclease
VVSDPPLQPVRPIPFSDLFRLTVEQFHEIARAGILDSDDPVELLEGLLIRRDSPAVPVPAGMIDASEIYPLTVEQYDELSRVGVLSEDDRVELLEGVLVRKMTIHPPHTGTVRRCRTILEALTPVGWRYRSEQPIVLPDSKPEPDGVIARGTPADDDLFHPPAADVVLVIEVADATLTNDRVVKLRTYARAGIPVNWIINLIDRQVEVHTDPDPRAEPHPAYRRREVYATDASVLIPVANVAVAVASLLPPLK